MKTALLTTVVVFHCLFLSAQTANPPQDPTRIPETTKAPYLANPIIPPFHLLKLDSSTYWTKDDLKKNKKTLIMFFSPDCDHCKHQTDSILANEVRFKDIQIVMATYQPFDEMKQFNAHYRLADHPNIRIGRDDKFFLVPFYRIRNLPYLALYDKKGNLITTFEGTQKINNILNAFQQEGKAE